MDYDEDLIGGLVEDCLILVMMFVLFDSFDILVFVV